MALKAFEVFGEVDLRGEEKVKKSLGGLTGGAGGLAAGFAVGAAAVAAAGVAAGAAAIKLGKLAEEESTANSRILNITESMGLFGGEAQAVTDRLTELARKQALATGIDSIAIKETQAKLMTFKELAASADEAGGAFDRATTLALDMEAAGFGSASENATQLGKALQDPIKGITALNRSGITFTETEKAQIAAMVEAGNVGEAHAMILGVIETQVGGTAEATANASDKMGVAFDEMKKALGERVLPVFEGLATTVTEKVLPAFDKLMSGDISLADLIPEPVMDVFRTIGDIFGPAVDTITESFENMKSSAGPALDSLKNAWDQIKPVLEVVAGILGGVVAVAVGAVIGVINGLMGAVNGVMQAVGGIVAVISGVVNLVIGIVTGDGAKISDAVEGIGTGITDVFGGLWNAVKGFITGFVDGVVSFFTGLFDTIIGHSIIPDLINGIVDWFTGLPGKAASALSGFITAVTTAMSKTATSAIKSVDMMVLSIINSLRSSPIFGPLLDAAENVWRKVKEMKDKVIGFVKDLVRGITAPIREAGDKLRELSPFTRHSPSLVEQVLSGTQIIRRAYEDVGGMSVGAPALAGSGYQAGAMGAQAAGGANVIIIADPRYTDMDKVNRDARAMQRGAIGTGSLMGRMGMGV